MVKRVAIIPARGGSKRIPRKNIVDFCGKPMIGWTIQAALDSKLFDVVFVSTEDPEIAQVSKSFGAEVPFLRASHFDDHSTVSEAVVDSVVQLQNHYQTQFDVVAQLMANCPVRSAEDIANAIANFENENHSFQISCFEFGWMNPWWAVRLDLDGCPKPLFPEALKTRSQDLEALYCPTGAIWLAQTVDLLRSKTFYGPNYRFFPLPWTAAVDIDEYQDLFMAKAVMSVLENESTHSN